MCSSSELSRTTYSVNVAWETGRRSRSTLHHVLHLQQFTECDHSSSCWPELWLNSKACVISPFFSSVTLIERVGFAYTLFSKHSLLCVDAGIPAVSFSLKVVCIALTASIPELCAGIGLGVIVPLDYVLSTGTWVQRLTAPFIWKDKKGAMSELLGLD